MDADGLAEELARTREALAAAERRFEAFTRNLPGLAWIKDRDGRYTYANAEAMGAFGLNASDLYGRTDAEIFPRATAQLFRENDRRVIEAGRGLRTTETLTHGDGRLHYSIVSKFPIPGPNGEIGCIGGMAIDVTEQKRAQQALVREQELLQKIIDAIPVMIAMYGPDAELMRVNREFTRVLGWTEEEAKGLSLMEKTYPDRELRAQVQAFMDACRPGWLDMPMRSRAGRVVETSWANIRLSDNTRVGIGIDIGERKRAELALRDADRRKDEFLATLSHELRNPLAAVRAGLDVLRLRDGHDTDGTLLPRVENQVHQLVRLTDDLLDVSRIHTGKLVLRLAPVVLADVVSDAVEASRPVVEAGAHTLDISLPDETIVLHADRTRLAQVMTNLLNNSAKFTERGGRIRIEAERDTVDVTIRVHDTGIGMPPALVPLVFEMFTQVDRSPERRHDGMGIGLSLVRALVDMHCGSVHAKSEGPGLGSTFTIRLPLAPSDMTHVAPPALATGADSTAPRRILVVDDNEDAAETLGLLLDTMGHDVRVTHDGPAALEAVNDFTPDVVFLDIGMPGMNGYEVARRMRAIAELDATVLVAVTGWGQDEDRERSREAGFHLHVVKPVDAAGLRSLLASVGDRERPATA